MSEFEVKFYETLQGRMPAEEFICEQNIKMRARIYRSIELLELKGNSLREPYSKELGDGIFELRVQQGNDAVRVLYFFVIDRTVILTNGFRKKTRKTPSAAIELAKKYRADYLERVGEVND